MSRRSGTKVETPLTSDNCDHQWVWIIRPTDEFWHCDKCRTRRERDVHGPETFCDAKSSLR